MEQAATTPTDDLPSSTEANDTQATGEHADPAISTRIRTSLALAQTRITAVPSRARAQIEDLPAQVREALDRLVVRARGSVRNALDLPSRTELTELLERVEALDAKLDDIQASGSNGKAKAKRLEAIDDAVTKRAAKPARSGKAKKSPK